MIAIALAFSLHMPMLGAPLDDPGAYVWARPEPMTFVDRRRKRKAEK